MPNLIITPISQDKQFPHDLRDRNGKLFMSFYDNKEIECAEIVIKSINAYEDLVKALLPFATDEGFIEADFERARKALINAGIKF